MRLSRLQRRLMAHRELRQSHLANRRIQAGVSVINDIEQHIRCPGRRLDDPRSPARLLLALWRRLGRVLPPDDRRSPRPQLFGGPNHLAFSRPNSILGRQTGQLAAGDAQQGVNQLPAVIGDLQDVMRQVPGALGPAAGVSRLAGFPRPQAIVCLAVPTAHSNIILPPAPATPTPKETPAKWYHLRAVGW